MIRCSTCGGLSPTALSCPNCAAGSAPAARTWLKSLGVAVGGATVGMTLAACYGSPCAQYGADGECIGPPVGKTASAEDCKERFGVHDPEAAGYPACADWYHDGRCEEMQAAKDPALAQDEGCADWNKAHEPAGSGQP